MNFPKEFQDQIIDLVIKATTNKPENGDTNLTKQNQKGGKLNKHQLEERLYTLATENRNFYFDRNKTTYIEVQDTKQQQVICTYLIEIESSDFTRWITRECKINFKQFLKDKYLIDTIKILVSEEARLNGQQIDLHNRIANVGDAIYIDLGTMNRNMIKVTKEGWSYGTFPNVFFKRHKDMAELPIPSKNGDLMLLIPYLPPMPTRDQCFSLCWLIGSFFVNIERAFLLIEGEQGVEKTSLGKLLKDFIDPMHGGATSYNDNVLQMAQLIDHHFIPLVDNVTGISRKVSDLICSAFSEGSITKKKNYTDDEDFIFTLSGNIIFTSIKLQKPKGDFLNRCYKIEMKKVNSTYRSKQEFTKDMEKEKSLIFGGVLDTLVKTMNKVDQIPATGIFRTVDFDRHATAAAEVMGYGTSTFSNARKHCENIKLRSITNSTPLIEALSNFLKSHNHHYSGYMGKLLQQLPQYTSSPDELPKQANVLSRRIGEITPELNAAGIHAEKQYNNGGGVLWELTLVEQQDITEPIPTQENQPEPATTGEPIQVNQIIPPETSEVPEPVPLPPDFNPFTDDIVCDIAVQISINDDNTDDSDDENQDFLKGIL